MRINEKHYPLLFSAFRKDRRLNVEYIDQKDRRIIQEGLAPFFNAEFNVSKVSMTFLTETYSNKSKVIGFLGSMPVGLYVMLMPRDIIHFVEILNSDHNSRHAVFITSFVRNKFLFAFEMSEGVLSGYVNKKSDAGSRTSVQDLCRVYGIATINCLLFKHYSEVKTKTLDPKEKVSTHHCRYFNETPFPIDLCDLNWYTQSCQNHPFVVRGHWRMQAHGQGMKQRKLIWIDEFTKQGYKKGAYKEDTK